MLSLKTAKVYLLLLCTILGFSACSVKQNQEVTPVTVPFSVLSFSPKSATIGTTITINGTGFGNEISAIKVRFGLSMAVRPVSLNNDQITVVVPVDATSGKISIDHTSAGTGLSEVNFDLLPDLNDYNSFSKIEYTGSGALVNKRDNFAAAGTGYYILFAGGNTLGPVFSDLVDVYNMATGIVTSDRLSEARSLLSAAATGNKIVFAGGTNATGYSDRVDIYDVVTNIWTTAKLSKARARMAAAATGDLIMFAGGESATNSAENVVDIYNTTSNTWTTATLALGRSNLAGAATQGKILFAGGTNATNFLAGIAVDIYDVNQKKWSTSVMSISRSNFSGAGTGNKIAFAGGSPVATLMEVYNTDTNTWSTVDLSAIIDGAAAAAGTKIAFSSSTRKLKVYDIQTGSVTNVTNSSEYNTKAAAAVKNKMLFGGVFSQAFDIYTLSK